MKNRTALLLLTCSIAFSIHSPAADSPPAPSSADTVMAAPNPYQRLKDRVMRYSGVESDSLFVARETSFSLGPTFTAAEPDGFDHVFDHSIRHGVYGVGAQANYFPSKYLGVGFEFGCTDIHNPSSYLIDYSATDLILRYPVGRLAPNISGGIGKDYKTGAFFTQVRAGVDVALNKRLRFSGDAAYRNSESGDSLLIRLFVSLPFS